jgi:hypothetical protein
MTIDVFPAHNFDLIDRSENTTINQRIVHTSMPVPAYTCHACNDMNRVLPIITGVVALFNHFP